MLSIGDLVWFRPVHASKPRKDKGVGMVIKIWSPTQTHRLRPPPAPNRPLYRVRWQKPENFRYPDSSYKTTSNCYDYQLVKVTTDA